MGQPLIYSNTTCLAVKFLEKKEREGGNRRQRSDLRHREIGGLWMVHMFSGIGLKLELGLGLGLAILSRQHRGLKSTSSDGDFLDGEGRNQPVVS